MAKITFTFPEDDDPIFSSEFVIVSPQRSRRSSAAFSPTPSQPERLEVNDTNRNTGAVDTPEESD